jgi:two-component system, oxyanion-binding sensor
VLPRPRLAVVHAFSTHDLLLRYGLAASGIDPERDVELVIIPPALTTEALTAGRIEGFFAGAPWGAVAAEAGVGQTVLHSSAIWRNHPEKCLAVRAAWAEREPAMLQGLLRALLCAGLRCDEPASAARLAGLLAAPNRVGVPAGLIRASLAGGEDGVADRSIFAAHLAACPWRSQARWFVAQMGRWRVLPEDAATRAGQVYRPDLYAEAARSLGLSVPLAAAKAEGGHATAWMLPAMPSAVVMLPDRFCDDAVFLG